MPSNKQSAAALALLMGATVASAGPCDIYSSGGTPCVAAHSTTRALYTKFSGALYQVKRGSDGTVKDVPTLSAGGTANAAVQDKFCSGTSCLVSIIYDQSGNGNHLTQAPPRNGTQGGKPDNLADATAAPITVGGKKAYGLFIVQDTGYRNDKTKGIAVLDQPEGIYAVLDVSQTQKKSLTDKLSRNAEAIPKDQGQGTMESLYFGSAKGSKQNHLTGNGPFVEADLENGLYASLNASSPSPSISARFVHASLRGGHNRYALGGGNAVTGDFTTYYDGPRPQGNYTKMDKKGGIILGIGGDNSNGAVGTWYEGCMTTGFPTDATESSVQANIVAAKYAA